MKKWAERESLRSLRHSNFRRLFAASLVSNLGSWAQMIAQDWLVLELTDSALALSIVTLLQLSPALALSLPAGVIADRYSKRNVLIVTNLLGSLSALTLGTLIITDHIALWQVMVMAFILGSVSALDNPVRMALQVEIVGRDDLPNAVSLNSMNFNIARLVGPALSGLLIRAFGTGPSFILNAASFVFVIIALLRIRTDELHVEPRAEVKGTIREGWDYIWARPDLKAVLLAAFFTSAFGLNFNFFNAMMVTKVFHLDAAVFGTLGTIVAIGSLTGAFLSARLERWRTPGNMLRGAVVFGTVVALISLAPNLGVYAALLPLGGVTALLTLITANSCMQLHTDPAVRGRVLAWYVMAFNAPFGQPLLGWISDQVGVRGAIAIGGAVTATSAIAIALRFRGRLSRPADYSIDAVLDAVRRV